MAITNVEGSRTNSETETYQIQQLTYGITNVATNLSFFRNPIESPYYPWILIEAITGREVESMRGILNGAYPAVKETVATMPELR